MNNKIDVLDHGYVLFVRSMGNDQSICDSARVSYNLPQEVSELKNRKLLEYMLTHGHTSPFEHVILTFEISLPIYLMRQVVRHRTASINEVSARYTQLPDVFNYPKWREKGNDKNKQGSGDEFVQVEQDDITKEIRELNGKIYETYEKLLEWGVCREHARTILPVSIYTRCVWTMDLHNLMHFVKLRIDEHAQKEIQEYAKAILFFMNRVAPVSTQLFCNNVLNWSYDTIKESVGVDTLLIEPETTE